MIAYTPNEFGRTAVNNIFWFPVSMVVNAVPSGEPAVIMMDTIAGTGKRYESTPDRVMGAHGRDERNDNLRRLAEIAANGRLSIYLTRFCAHSNAG